MAIKIQGKIGNLDLKNRMIMAPVKTAFGNIGGTVTDKQIRFYDQVSSGGISMVILEPIAVQKNGREHPKQMCLDNECIDGITRIIDVIHKNGSLVCAHFNHAGRAANPKLTSKLVSSSESICPTTGAKSRSLNKSEIDDIIRSFGEKVKIASGAGFDAVEIQFGHGYLVSQFLSDRINKRTDDYGGSPENRMRFGLRIAEAVLENKGKMSVIARISGSEFVDGGLNPDNQFEFLNKLIDMGIDAIHVGWGNACDNPAWYYNHMSLPQDIQFDLLKKVRQNIKTPLIVVGRMSQIENVNRIFDENLADFVSMGRQMVIDPEYPNKIMNDRIEDIKFCGACLQGCLVNVKNGTGIGCVVNPFVAEPPIEKAEISKKAIVIGGGPAGLISSIVLRKRGHNVKLYEKEKTLGGQFYLASIPNPKKMMLKPLQGLIREAEINGVDIDTGINVSKEKLKEENPDVVVVATGTMPNFIKFKGIENKWHITGNEALIRNDIKDKRVLVVGGGMIGLEVAEKLCEDDNDVTLVEILPELASDMEPITKKLILKLLEKMKFNYMVKTAIQEFREDGVIVKTDNDKIKNLGRYDVVVFAVGTHPENELYEEIKNDFKEVVLVGDASRPSNAYTVTKMAYEMTKKL